MANLFQSFNQGFTAGREIRDARMKRNALLEAGQAFQSGDYKTAGNALFAYDPPAAMQVQQYGAGLERQKIADQKTQQEDMRAKAERLLKGGAQVAQAVKALPPEQRIAGYRDGWTRIGPALGVDQRELEKILEGVTPDKLSDQALDATISMAMDPEGYAKLQQQLAQADRPFVLGAGDQLRSPGGALLASNPRAAQAAAGGNGVAAPAPAAGGPTPMPEYGPNAYKLANGSIVEIYRDKQGQPRIGKTLVTGPGGGNPDTVKTILTQRAGRQSLLLEDIGRAKKLAGKGAVGWGATLKEVPQTASKDLAALLETIKSNIGFAELQAMRDSSPTGGALGQVTERELALLQAVVGSLDQAQSREQFTANLDRLERQYQQSMAAIAAAYERDFGQPLDLGSGLPAPPMPGGAPVEDPLGIR